MKNQANWPQNKPIRQQKKKGTTGQYGWNRTKVHIWHPLPPPAWFQYQGLGFGVPVTKSAGLQYQALGFGVPVTKSAGLRCFLRFVPGDRCRLVGYCNLLRKKYPHLLKEPPHPRLFKLRLPDLLCSSAMGSKFQGADACFWPASCESTHSCSGTCPGTTSSACIHACSSALLLVCTRPGSTVVQGMSLCEPDTVPRVLPSVCPFLLGSRRAQGGPKINISSMKVQTAPRLGW